MAPRTREMAPSLAASLVLHVAVLALGLIVWPRPAIPLAMASSVPVNIVPNAPTTDIRPAVEAPLIAEAQASEPDPVAPPAIVAPREEPTPAPPVPRPAPQPRPAPPRPTPPPKVTTPAPGQTQQRRPAAERPDAPSDDFIRNLEQRLAQTPRTSGRPNTGGRRGTPRPPTAPTAAPDAGDGFSVSEQNQLTQRLMELWNPNCNVSNGAVRIRVRVRINSTGHLVGAPRAEGIDSEDLVVRVNAERAVRAFRQAEQLGYLPVNLPDGDLLINFDPSQVCGG